MSLRQPVEVPAWDALGPVHFIGVGGVSMSEIARILAGRGVRVSGSDREESAALEPLRAAGVTVHVGHDAANLGPDIATVVINSAIGEDNPELAAARARGLRVLHRSVVLASLMAGKRGIGIAGTNGKTTTTAMTVAAMAAVAPSYAVGAPLAATGLGSALHDGPWFVIEADESDGSFLQYDLELVAVTNVEADHLDNWGTPAAYRDGFVRFATRPDVACAVLNADDPGSAALAEARRAAGRDVVTFGQGATADVRLTDVAAAGPEPQARVGFRGTGGTITLQVPGLHELYDAAAAYALARLAGVDDAAARAGLCAYRGTARRFQPVATVAGVRIVDDYAHHPTKVAAALASGRAVVGDGRLVACFQPHLYSRTRDFAAGFGRALAAADVVVVIDVYPAREQPIPGISGHTIVDAIAAADPSVPVVWCPALDDAAGVLAELARPGDLVMTIGAGSVTRVGPALAGLLGRA